ncbi:hypothetical protein ACI65C_006687 [Semiaphis heraclei]
MANDGSTYTVFSLAKIAYNACDEIERYWYNEQEVPQLHIGRCCKWLFEIIAENTNSGEFDPHGYRRSTYKKVREFNAVHKPSKNVCLDKFKGVYNYAACYGHLDCMKMSYELGIPWDAKPTTTAHIKAHSYSYMTCEYAAAHGNIECMQYAWDHGCPWDGSTCAAAAGLKRVDCLQYLRKNGCPWDHRTVRAALYAGSLETLVYAVKNGCPVDSYACALAAITGKMECLKYLHKNGAPWDTSTCLMASIHGHVDCLRYAHRNGCPFNRFECMRAASVYENEDCLLYLRSITQRMRFLKRK